MKQPQLYPSIIFLFFDVVSGEHGFYDVNLPEKHLPYFFHDHPKEANLCLESSDCPFKKHLNTDKCWGYESDCAPHQRYSTSVCSKGSKGWAKSKQEQADKFFHQGDFGYIQDQMNELVSLCSSKYKNGTSFECTRNLRFCRGRNIMLDFKSLESLPEPMRYRDDVIKKGQVGGHCKLNKKLLKQQGQHKSPLQSWFAEFEHFTELTEEFKNGKHCDVTLTEPTFVMKLDATVNMYHHFCDFLNLYLSLHLNQTFSTDINIIVWDTLPYVSNFAPVWNAFSRHPIMNLGQFKGKKVCFENVVFPLLPRMIFGMYYNMPLIPGCEKSGVFQAFTEHLKHRLKIQDKFQGKKIRVTLISRSTQYRRILNEDELITSLNEMPELAVQKVNFNRQMDFLEQMQISFNTDILIGMHGAGLTHMLFMPEWGAVFEIFNCEDESCYADLARLKGLKYLTWEKPEKLTAEDEGHHPTLGAHAKFTNYSFDVAEFVRLLKKALHHVTQHSAFQAMQQDSCSGAKCNKTFSHIEL